MHRIGRTARAEAEGMAFTLISEKEQGKFAVIEQLLGKEVEKAMVPDIFGPAPAYNPRHRSNSGRQPQRKFHRSSQGKKK